MPRGRDSVRIQKQADDGSLFGAEPGAGASK
jgi:hypothetical protein